MTRIFMCILAVVVLTVCLLSGGCSLDNPNLKSWKDLFNPVPAKTTQDAARQESASEGGQPSPAAVETLDIKLYFADPQTGKLIREDRKIEKTRAVARKVMEELIKGPEVKEHTAVFPEGTRLLDINIRSTDQVCIVDLSPEARKLTSKEQEEMLVYAVADTLGQFPGIKEVSFLINGERVDTLAGYVDLSRPVKPDYNI